MKRNPILFLLMAGVALLVASCNDKPVEDPKTITDIDGNVYKTIRMGSQLWMAENLRTTHFADGTEIPVGTEFDTKNPLRYLPKEDPASVERYGYLYNWAAAVRGGEHSMERVQGPCPDGWHMPSKSEFEILINHVGHTPEYICEGKQTYIAKALASQSDWKESSEPNTPGNNPSANNATGMNFQPVGYLKPGASLFGESAHFWTSTDYISEMDEVNPAFTHAFDIYPNRAEVEIRVGRTPESAYSIRCIKDQE